MSIPEIARCDPTMLLLQLKGLGVKNLLEFEYLQAPSVENISNSL